MKVVNPILKTWTSLNKGLLTMGEKQCSDLLSEEKKGRNRHEFLLRIHSRINRVRAQRERKELSL